MLILIAVLTAAAVALLVLSFVQFTPNRAAVVVERLDQFRRTDGGLDTLARRRRQARSERLRSLLQVLGERVESRRGDTGEVRQFLIQAGYSDPAALPIYWALRVILGAGLGLGALLVLPVLGAHPTQVGLAALWLGGLGWILPTFVVRSQLKRRQKEVQLALPDMLDLLVVCVEAGLGINQALTRVADEIDHVSSIMSEELTLANLEIRAGTPREEALKHFADRTGLADIRSLVGMMIQTERFGTSIATALRVQADTLRTKRRQRAEEAAAKTTIKLVFPLVLFVFPAMFAVVLGPSVIVIFRMFNNLHI
ncbi:MAG TPA: type II secretion system F family protein [Gemmatimonadales bacterium]|nr:type II secretion system F family protein [Gemmatimonadales bacterium]